MKKSPGPIWPGARKAKFKQQDELLKKTISSLKTGCIMVIPYSPFLHADLG
jgi:hypothetical protein